MSVPCPACGLKRWDADDLIPGDFVCTCDELDDDALPADADYAWRDGHGVLAETVTDISAWGQA